MTPLNSRVAAMLLDNPETAARIVVRAIEDAMTAALPAYWRRRARQLAEVGTPWASGAALACANHALLLESEARGIDVLDLIESRKTLAVAA